MVRISEVNAIPIMTSNTAPSGVVSASSENTPAWRALDDSSSDWITSSGDVVGSWWQYKFDSPKIISRYTIKASSDLRTLRSFVFKASNDGVTWDDLDSRTVDWTSMEEKTFDITNNNKAYLYYRISVTEGTGTEFVIINRIKMYEGIFDKKIIIKNTTTNKDYSLAEKTLIKLPNTSSETIVEYGINSGVEIKLDEPFVKIQYVQDTSEVLGEGKIYKHETDLSNVKANKLIL